MEEKQLKKEIKRIHKAIKKMERIPQYNLSGSAWQDFCTAREIYRISKRSEKNLAKRRECAWEIAHMLIPLKTSGYPIDDILKKYDIDTVVDIMCNGGIEDLRQHYIERRDDYIYWHDNSTHGNRKGLFRNMLHVDVKPVEINPKPTDKDNDKIIESH